MSGAVSTDDLGAWIHAFRDAVHQHREELTRLLLDSGCREVLWKFPEETGFYQPMVIAKK